MNRATIEAWLALVAAPSTAEERREQARADVARAARILEQARAAFFADGGATAANEDAYEAANDVYEAALAHLAALR